jgi:hypothetical protein
MLAACQSVSDARQNSTRRPLHFVRPKWNTRKITDGERAAPAMKD